MDWSREILSQSVDQTLDIGRALGGALRAGDVVALVGALGAGKTHLAKGIAVGLGVADPRQVNSPTFVLVNEYHARVPIYHVDAYRLTLAKELGDLGFEEMCAAGGVVLVEWADRVAPAFEREALWVVLRDTGESRRQMAIRTASEDLAARLSNAGLDRWQDKLSAISRQLSAEATPSCANPKLKAES